MNIMLSQIIIVYLINKLFMISNLCFYRLIFNLILLTEGPNYKKNIFLDSTHNWYEHFIA
jgi:hypothetical protein